MRVLLQQKRAKLLQDDSKRAVADSFEIAECIIHKCLNIGNCAATLYAFGSHFDSKWNENYVIRSRS